MLAGEAPSKLLNRTELRLCTLKLSGVPSNVGEAILAQRSAQQRNTSLGPVGDQRVLSLGHRELLGQIVHTLSESGRFGPRVTKHRSKDLLHVTPLCCSTGMLPGPAPR